MTKMTPSPIRSTVTDDEFGGFRITIPQKSDGGGGCAFGCLLVIWAVPLLFTVASYAAGPTVGEPGRTEFLVVWLTLGLVVVALLVYAVPMGEIVVIDGKALVIRTEFIGRKHERRFDLAEVRNLRPARTLAAAGRVPMITFDYGRATTGFGLGLPQAEVLRIIKTIRQRFRIPDDLDEAEPLPIET